MKKQIYALTDYKNNFGSKWGSIPYRSGFNKDLLRKHFNKFGWDIKFIQFKNVSFNDDWENKIVIYTSSEEKGLYYKSYIEDIILGLGRVGAIVIPRYDFLRSNNNKVYMEILREKLLGKELSGISSYLYGTLEELRRDLTERKIQFPCVLKTAGGAMSRGVYLANNTKDLLRYAKRISRTFHCFHEAKEIFRSKKYKGYQKESKFQHKFIVQNFIPELINDWKILIFGNHYYVLNRGIKVNDFRASGSGYNYFAGSESRITNEMLNFLKWLYNKFDVPHLSVDFAFNGINNIIHEFQAIHFGTSTMNLSRDLYVFNEIQWDVIENSFSQEEEYVNGIIYYLSKHSETF